MQLQPSPHRLEWPVRTLSFSYDGKLIASASEDLVIDVAEVETGECLHVFTTLPLLSTTSKINHIYNIIIKYIIQLLLLYLPLMHTTAGEKVVEIACESPTFTVAWHPRRLLLAYACDDKYDRERDAGTLKLFGLPEGKD